MNPSNCKCECHKDCKDCDENCDEDCECSCHDECENCDCDTDWDIQYSGQQIGRGMASLGICAVIGYALWVSHGNLWSLCWLLILAVIWS
jgi:hypothetical protein